MKEISNSQLVSSVSQINVSQGAVQPNVNSTKYAKFKDFATRYFMYGDAIAKFIDPDDADESGLRAACVEEDGTFSSDKIHALFRMPWTKTANNNIRSTFAEALLDRFGDVDLVQALGGDGIETMKLEDFIGDKAAKSIKKDGRLYLSEFVTLTKAGKTGRPLTSRRINAIADVLEQFVRDQAELRFPNGSSGVGGHPGEQHFGDESNLVISGDLDNSKSVNIVNGAPYNGPSVNNKEIVIDQPIESKKKQEKVIANEPIGSKKIQKLSPKDVSGNNGENDGKACEILASIFNMLAWPGGNDDGAEGCKTRFATGGFTLYVGGQKLDNKSVDLSKALKAVFNPDEDKYDADPLKSSYDMATAFLLKMLARVSRYGVDSFLYDSITDCHDDYVKNKSEVKHPTIKLNFTSQNVQAKSLGVTDKRLSLSFELEVIDGNRKVKAVFKTKPWETSSLFVVVPKSHPVLTFTDA